MKIDECSDNKEINYYELEDMDMETGTFLGDPLLPWNYHDFLPKYNWRELLKYKEENNITEDVSDKEISMFTYKGGYFLNSEDEFVNFIGERDYKGPNKKLKCREMLEYMNKHNIEKLTDAIVNRFVIEEK